MWSLKLPSLGSAATLMGVLTLMGCGAKGTESADQVPLVVERGELLDERVLTGELAAAVAVEVVAPDAPVRPLEIRWVAEDGQEVSQGDRLVVFDSTSLVADLEDRRTRVQEAANQLEQARADAAVAVAEAQLNLASTLAAYEKAKLEAQVPEDLVSALEYGEKQLTLRRTELQWRQSQEALEARREQGISEIGIAEVAERKARFELERRLRGLELLTLSAPRDGIFLPETNFREGRPWAEGDSLWPGQRIARLPDLGSLRVRAQLPDVDGDAVEPGEAAVVTLDAYPDLQFAGRVGEVEQAAQQAGFRSARRFFGVTVEMEGVDPSWMRPGMSARVLVARRICQDCLLAPRRALRLDGEGGARALLRSGKWVSVKLGPCSDFRCAVDEGLEEGVLLAPADDPEVPA